MIQGTNPGRDKKLFSSPKCADCLWNPPSLLSKGYQGSFLEVWGLSLLSCAEVKNEWRNTSIFPSGLLGLAQTNVPGFFLGWGGLIHHYISAKVQDITSQKAAVFIAIALRSWSLTWWFVLQILHQDALLKPLNMVQQFLTPLSSEDMSQQDNFKERQVSSVLTDTALSDCSPLSTACHDRLYKHLFGNNCNI
jgi:hypothetical protein